MQNAVRFSWTTILAFLRISTKSPRRRESFQRSRSLPSNRRAHEAAVCSRGLMESAAQIVIPCKFNSMKVVILAGGYGTRISEETQNRPKPMVEIGGNPILWHIMKIYSHYGLSDFIICLGFKGYVIKEYFANYCSAHVGCHVRFDEQRIDHARAEYGKLARDTRGHRPGDNDRRPPEACGAISDTDEPFCMTYGDGVGDIDITKACWISSQPREEGHSYGRDCSGAVWRLAHDRDFGRWISGEAGRRRRLD